VWQLQRNFRPDDPVDSLPDIPGFNVKVSNLEQMPPAAFVTSTCWSMTVTFASSAIIFWRVIAPLLE